MKDIYKATKSDIDLIIGKIGMVVDKKNYKGIIELINNYIELKKRPITIEEASEIVLKSIEGKK